MGVAIRRSDLEIDEKVVIAKVGELERTRKQLESLRKTNANTAEIEKARKKFSLARCNVQLVKAGKPAMTQEQRDAAREARAEAAKASTSTCEKPATVPGVDSNGKRIAWTFDRRRLAEDDDCRTFRETLRAV